MIPLEYTMVREDESFAGIGKELFDEAAKMGELKYNKYLDKKIMQNPKDPLPYVKKSIILQSQPMKALEVLEKGFLEAGENHLLYHSRAMIYAKAGQSDKAIGDLKKALDLYPIAVESIVTLGTLLNRAQRYEEAISYWDRLIEMNPTDWIAWNGKSQSEFNLKDYGRALKHATAAIYCDPMPAFHENRALIYMETGRIDEALSDYEEALRLGGDKDHVVNNMKKYTIPLMKSGKVEELTSIYEKINEIEPDNVDTLMGLCGLYKAQNRSDKMWELAGKLQIASLKIKKPAELEFVAEAFLGMDLLRDAAKITIRLYEMTKEKGYLLNLGMIAKELNDHSLIAPYVSELKNIIQGNGISANRKNINVNRNDPCPCGSGSKFKKCCGA
jgi:tetratricopeptide (TPR) repeat protein